MQFFILQFAFIMLTHRLLCFALALLTSLTAFAAEDPLKAKEIPESAPWAAASIAPLPDRPFPRLFLSGADFKAIREKVATQPWAASALARLISSADEALTRPLEIPDLPGEWGHNYICKTCGIKLEYKNKTHRCSRCGKTYTGWPYDGIVAGRAHSANISDARAMALAWQLTGKAPYAARVREILLAYADRYPNLKIHDYRGGTDKRGARLFAQTLDESVHFIPLVWAYDLTHDAPVFSDADRQHIENDLLRKAAVTIRRNDMTISNWQTWHNAAIAAIGYTLNDAAMVDFALNGKSGLTFQLKRSVLPDGFWYEGTPTYHAYSLQALQHHLLAMRAAGSKLYLDPTVKSLYEAPLLYAMPNGNFPTVNDSESLSIFSMDEAYEVAYTLYKEARFAWPLEADGHKRGEAALLFGSPALPPPVQSDLESHNFPGLGASLLRAGQAALHLDYGPHGGAHGHFDKLGVILYANGIDALPDPGRLDYGAPLHAQWYKTSLAHNTVIMDGKNQEPAEGKLIASDYTSDIQYATATCDTAYKDVTLTRSVALGPNFYLDLTTAQAPENHTWDLAWHGRGTLGGAAFPAAKLTENSHGYQVLKQTAKSPQPVRSYSWQFKGVKNKGSLHLQTLSSSPMQIITGQGVTDRAVTPNPVVLLRQTGSQVQWLTLVSFGAPLDVEVKQDATQAVGIQVKGQPAMQMINGQIIPAR